MVARLLGYILSVSLLTGCANASPQLRLSRTLVALGATAMVVGGLIATGCSEPGTGDSGCSGGPTTSDPEDGLPVVAAGAALIGAGFLAKPPEQGRLFRPGAPLPIPMLPDPFAPTLPQYPP
jgi:hypothetical protein